MRPWLALVALLACVLSRAPAQRALHRQHLATHVGVKAGDQFGFSLDGIGDVDGDRHPDYAIGAWLADTVNGKDSGAVTVFSGRTGGVLRTLPGPRPGAHFGFVVRGAGDVDGDGRPDLAVGLSGELRVFSGRSWALLRRFVGKHASFGLAADAGADFDGDGRPDLAVGISGDRTRGVEAGSVVVFSGRTGAVLRKFFGDAAGDQMGISVAFCGDVDGDGRADLIAGAWKNDRAGRDAGLARVWSAKTGRVLWQAVGKKQEDFFGNSVSGCGDVDGNGTPDVIVGAYRASRPLASMGEARVFDGKTGKPLHTFGGTHWGDFFGVAVAGAGDVDRDGHADLLVGAWGENDNGGDSGSLRVFSGKTGRVLRQFNGKTDQLLGVSVAAAGDVNQDDWPDFLVGAVETKIGAGHAQLLTYRRQFLRADRCCVSVTLGGSQRLSLDAGASEAGRVWLMLGTASGTRPGIRVGGITIPISVDAYHVFLLGTPNTLLLPTLGVLDRKGRATTRFVLPPLLAIALRGRSLHHAFVTLAPPARITSASNAVPVRF